MKSAVIIIPTIGKPEFKQSFFSCLNQTYKNLKIYVVIDGAHYSERVLNLIPDDLDLNENLKIVVLPENVGANGWYGHRIYSAFSLLVNQDYVFFLDEDNFLEKNHVESMINTCEENNLQWCYSLRNVVDSNGNFLFQDNCESLGMWVPFTNYKHVDTSCYCLSLDIARQFSHNIFGQWGADRAFFTALDTYTDKYKTSGLYTVNYRLGGNDGSVKQDFFIFGNEMVQRNYNGNFPWRK